MSVSKLAACGHDLETTGGRQSVLEGLKNLKELEANGFNGLVNGAAKQVAIGAGDAMSPRQQPELLAEVMKKMFFHHGMNRVCGPGREDELSHRC